MRRSFTLSLDLLAAIAGFGVCVLLNAGAAEARPHHSARTQPVVITPRYLSAGTAVSNDEKRGAVIDASVHYRSIGYVESGPGIRTPARDPFYLPRSPSLISFDSPFGRKLPGEQ